jgi:hypothetical protein
MRMEKTMNSKMAKFDVSPRGGVRCTSVMLVLVGAFLFNSSSNCHAQSTSTAQQQAAQAKAKAAAQQQAAQAKAQATAQQQAAQAKAQAAAQRQGSPSQDHNSTVVSPSQDRSSTVVSPHQDRSQTISNPSQVPRTRQRREQSRTKIAADNSQLADIRRRYGFAQPSGPRLPFRLGPHLLADLKARLYMDNDIALEAKQNALLRLAAYKRSAAYLSLPPDQQPQFALVIVPSPDVAPSVSSPSQSPVTPTPYPSPTTPNPSPVLLDVVKMTQVHLSDDAILEYVKNRSQSYFLSPSDILSLSRQGVSQKILSAMLQNESASAEKPTEPASAEKPTEPAPAEKPTEPAPVEKPAEPASPEKPLMAMMIDTKTGLQVGDGLYELQASVQNEDIRKTDDGKSLVMLDTAGTPGS